MSRCLNALMLPVIPALILTAAGLARAESTPETVEFNRDIRPILAENCFQCHGPDENKREADLRLDTPENVFQDRDGYSVIVPGDLQSSELFLRMTAKDESKRMPPADAERTVTDRELLLIRRWIQRGARWQDHWSLIPPSRPRPPTVSPPSTSWGSNPIDSFILARLEREGLAPSQQADRTTLIRRVTFDLTGLPPTPKEVDAFLADNTPQAWEKLVDRLLRSPQYGERMASYWLDLARYADTHGYHIDNRRDMWLWRDWVVEAFNANMPFDQFTIEQLAGDLLPSPTLRQQIGSGFNRNNMVNHENGNIEEEWLVQYAVDRADTTATVWMALTIRCAQCHDHKYDPLTQDDFYRLFGFFNNIAEKGIDGRKGNAVPYIRVPTDHQQSELAQTRSRILELNRQLHVQNEQLDRVAEESEREMQDTIRQQMQEARQGLIAHYSFDSLDRIKSRQVADVSGHQGDGEMTGPADPVPGPLNGALRLTGRNPLNLGNVADFEHTSPFSCCAWIHPETTSNGTLISRLDGTDTQQRGFIIKIEDGRIAVRLVHQWYFHEIRVRSKETLEPKRWQHIVITWDGSGKAAGVKILVDGRFQHTEVSNDGLTGTIRTTAPLYVGRGPKGDPFRGRIDDLRFYDRKLPQVESMALMQAGSLGLILGTAAGLRTAEQTATLKRHYLENHNAAYQHLQAELTHLKNKESSLETSLATTMVMQERTERQDTFVLVRGDYRQKGKQVAPGTPASLPGLPDGASANRLGLAEWLVDPSHPLTARVMVNRFWQMSFGTGIVKTSEDFGTQGDWPTHPELLDWLATEFIRNGWDIKAIQRLILTSSTYRRSSRATPELLRRDPNNRLLARGPRFRLSAEMIRDNALAVSGLLDNRLGGEGVFPYQPPGLWREVGYLGPENYSAQIYEQSHGRDLYRRSLYTFWKRTVPPPGLATFDAPNRETCIVRRARTNTPLQALMLLNDPMFVEAARALATRTIIECSGSQDERITFLFRLTTARRPDNTETRSLSDVLDRLLADFRKDTDSAAQLLNVGESPVAEKLDRPTLAAWTCLANMVLNLDESITKE